MRSSTSPSAHRSARKPDTLAEHRRQAAFSLTEILVVLGITTILSALLLPTAFGIRDRANESKCLSNLRNLAQATQLYQGEHDGYLPPNWAHSGGTADTTWTVVMRPYFQINDLNTYGTGTDQMVRALTCPSAPADEKPAKWWESNYAASLAFGTDGVPRKTLLKNAAKTLMFIDSARKGRSLYYTPSPFDTANPSIEYRHSGSANIIFLDGHSEKRRLQDLPPITDSFWGLY